MKFFIFILLLLISPIQLRRHDNDDEIYELDDLLNNKYDRHKYRPNKKYDDDDEDNNNDDEYIPSSLQHKKLYPSHKKVLNENEESENEIPVENDLPDTSTCLNKYEIRSEQLVKVKELKNGGARMIRIILLDKRTLSSNLNIKEHCILNCCSQKTCDLAMLSEQPSHDGYKCYLFSCNGNCTLASHQDYSIMIPKKDSVYYEKSATTITDIKSTSTLPTVQRSIFHETSVIIFLILGIISTIALFVFLFRHCQYSQKRGRKSKNHAVDADYLINGLYL